MSEAEQKRMPTSVEEIRAAMQFFSIAVASYNPNRPDHGRSGVRNALIAVIQLVAALFPNAPGPVQAMLTMKDDNYCD
jgi:hypothetical protein